MVSVLGVVLAGGASRRMGDREKVLERLGGRTLLQCAVERLAPQVDRVIVNGPPELADHCDVAVVPDILAGRAGPLAGLHAAMEAAREDVVVTVAADTPFFPLDLARRLVGEGVGIARSEGWMQPVFAAWPLDLKDRLATFLEAGDRKIMMFAKAEGYRAVEFDATANPFFNINTPDDLATARAMLETAS